MRRRIAGAGALMLGALLAASPAGAQVLGPPAGAPVADQVWQTPVLFGGLQATYARPTGEFREYVKHGGGMNVNVLWTPQREGIFGLRADGGFVVYGSERQRVCFSSTVGCRVQLDLRTTNSIASLNAGPQLMVPRGAVRPYANAGIGLAYFATTSELEGTRDNQPFASTTNFDDLTFAWLAGGGVLVPLSSGRNVVMLDLGARYNGNGQVEYLRKGDIQDNPDGSISFTPTRSQANLWAFHVGVSVGIRPGGPQD
jgi:opacity protein-like surface antigen